MFYFRIESKVIFCALNDPHHTEHFIKHCTTSQPRRSRFKCHPTNCRSCISPEAA